MKTINAPTIFDRIYAGAHGNKSISFSDFITDLEEDDDIKVFKLPTGLTVFGFRYAHEALGADGTTLQVKLGDDVLGEIDTSSDNADIIVIEPQYIQNESDLTLTAKGDALSGRLVILVEYVSTGY